jgi:hypothetical protein
MEEICPSEKATLFQNYMEIQPKDGIVYNQRHNSLKTSKLIALTLTTQPVARLTVYELFVYFQNCNLRIIPLVVLLVFPLSSSIPDNRNLKNKIDFLPNRNAMKMYSMRQCTAFRNPQI